MAPADSQRNFYDSEYHFAEDFEKPDLGRLRHALKELGPLDGTRFLDLGCGVGWATEIACREGRPALAVGLDFSFVALKKAAQLGADARWILADGCNLPFADASFDRVFSFGSLEHFPEIERGIFEAFRITKPGGRAVIVVPNFYVRTEQPVEHRDHYFGWRRLFENAGFRVVRVGKDKGPAILKNRRPIRMFLRAMLKVASTVPGLQYQFLFVLEKPT